MYQHLTMEQRYHIQAYKSAGYKSSEIALKINVHPSTISRELRRNCSTIQKRYSASSAGEVSRLRRKYASGQSNKKMNKELEKLIIKYLKKDWSPEQISATLRIKHDCHISHVRIYQFIANDRAREGLLYRHLRYQGKKRVNYGGKYRGQIEDRVSISQRPQIVDDKTRIGDFESDTIIGAGRKDAIVTAVDRKSMFVRISEPTTKKADDTAKIMIEMLDDLKEKIHTITTDNGFEFSKHKQVSQALNCDYYFCHPYSSWERGLNENINGLIRQYIPKGSSFKHLTKNDNQVIEDKLNHRPRKSLNWRTPYEVFYELKAA